MVTDHIRLMRDDWNITVILVEHDMRTVMDICERITELNFGEKLMEGVRAGNAAALQRLLELHWDPLVRYARRMLTEPDGNPAPGEQVTEALRSGRAPAAGPPRASGPGLWGTRPPDPAFGGRGRRRAEDGGRSRGGEPPAQAAGGLPIGPRGGTVVLGGRRGHGRVAPDRSQPDESRPVRPPPGTSSSPARGGLSMTEPRMLVRWLVEPGPVRRVREGRVHPATEGAPWTS